MWLPAIPNAGPTRKRKSGAELWAELIDKYGYKPERIGIEVTIPGRTPSNFADLVVYEDDVHLSPTSFRVQAGRYVRRRLCPGSRAGLRLWASLGAKYCGVAAGRTRRLLRFDRFRG